MSRNERSDKARVLYDEFKEHTPEHRYMLAGEFWRQYTIWLENELLKARKQPNPPLIEVLGG